MALPHLPPFRSVRDFAAWVKGVDAALRQHDARLASRRHVLISADGTRHLLVVANDGTLSTTPE